MRKKSREERYQQICDALASAEQPLLISEIGSRIGLRVTPWLRRLLFDLVDADVIQFEVVKLWNGTEGRAYSISTNISNEINPKA